MLVHTQRRMYMYIFFVRTTFLYHVQVGVISPILRPAVIDVSMSCDMDIENYGVHVNIRRSVGRLSRGAWPRGTI